MTNALQILNRADLDQKVRQHQLAQGRELPRAYPCKFMGEEVERVTCDTCAGHVELKVLQCGVFGACTIGKRHASVPGCCAGCRSYVALTPPRHPNIDAAEAFSLAIPEAPKFSGRGVVIAGGGEYWPGVYVSVRMLRTVGCTLPITVWYLGEAECDYRYTALLQQYDVTCVNAAMHPAAATAKLAFPGHPPFGLKTFAALYSTFAEVLVIDADNYVCADPTVLFDDPRYRRTGGIFWPDGAWTNALTKWDQWGVEKFGPDCGWETGQWVIDKRLAWRQLNMARWYDDHGDWCYGGASHHDHGDKGPHRVGWAMFRTSPTFFTTNCCWDRVAFLQPGPDGRNLMFIHRCRSKFMLRPTGFLSTPQNGVNIPIQAPMEAEAFAALEELRGLL